MATPDHSWASEAASHAALPPSRVGGDRAVGNEWVRPPPGVTPKPRGASVGSPSTPPGGVKGYVCMHVCLYVGMYVWRVGGPVPPRGGGGREGRKKPGLYFISFYFIFACKCHMSPVLTRAGQSRHPRIQTQSSCGAAERWRCNTLDPEQLRRWGCDKRQWAGK